MRVALFIDGKNFFAGWKDQTRGRDIDFKKMSRWIVRAAGGAHLMGAYYFTGVETSIPLSPAQEKLDSFLDMLSTQPGFFVQRFAQKNRTQVCQHCNTTHAYSAEKEVDTTMVADMLRLAAVGAFDIAVLLSGDADLVPAVEGVRALGKQVFVASWGSSGLSSRIRRAAFDHINLLDGLPEFERQGFAGSSSASTFAQPPAGLAALTLRAETGAPIVLSSDPEVHMTACIDEIRRAQNAMPGGYVGVHFFVTRWKSHSFAEIPDLRRRVIDRLVDQQKIEIYLTEDGVQAVKLRVEPPIPAHSVPQ